MTVRALSASDVTAAARSLGDAFADDPVMQWLGGFRGDPARLVPAMRAAITLRLRHEEPLVFTTAAQEANALWTAPGRPAMTNGELLRGLPAIVRSFRSGVARTAKVLKVMDEVHPSEPHYYLFAVGVRRDRQGRGLGSVVLQPMLDRCDAEGVPAYLENSNPNNTAFYARHGFEERDPVQLPHGCPPLVPMWREPR